MIRTEHLSKNFGEVQALVNLDLQVAQGTAFGFIGPNGAGKTTTMQILATLLNPSAGTAYVGGYDVVKEAEQVRQLIGYMPDFFGVYDSLTAVEYLEFYAACYGIERVSRRKRALELLELVNLADKRDEDVDSLSRGMKQRLGLARSLVHDPALLILDEPASGLDPRARIEFRKVLKELQAQGKTIMISSHILPELVGLCDTIGVMESGRLAACGAVEEMIKRMERGRVIEIRSRDRDAEMQAWLEKAPSVRRVTRDGSRLLVEVDGDESVQVELLQGLVDQRFSVYRFHEVALDIEDLFLQVTSSKMGEVTNEPSA